MNDPQIDELLSQALETELGGVQVYETAVRCAQREDLKREWTEYLAQTKRHVEIVRDVFEQLGLDSSEETLGRLIVRAKGQALVKAMETALEEGGTAAELVAAECVVDAETKDHQNWELIGAVAAKHKGDRGRILQAAFDQVEDEEDEHLYHTAGWCRELWIESLGMPAQLPPPEEAKDVKTAIGAARAKQDRKPRKRNPDAPQPEAAH